MCYRPAMLWRRPPAKPLSHASGTAPGPKQHRRRADRSAQAVHVPQHRGTAGPRGERAGRRAYPVAVWGNCGAAIPRFGTRARKEKTEKPIGSPACAVRVSRRVPNPMARLAEPTSAHCLSARACTGRARDVIGGAAGLSMRRGRTPLWARQSAGAKPVGPVPAMRSSYRALITPVREARSCSQIRGGGGFPSRRP